MFAWYQHAAICVVYLDDFVNPYEIAELASLESMVRNCRWFKRGWTLQELLASRKRWFYNRNWLLIGNQMSLMGVIHRVTGIAIEHLQEPLVASVAQKFSWAANRETTRVEDRAYSLMGLFGINMPLLYGEGEKAFQRLQQEILRSSNDESIFAWKRQGLWSSGLLARSLDDFADSGNIVPLERPPLYRPPYL